MFDRFRPRLTYANVVSTLCLFSVLGGGAYAATQLPRNSVGTKQLKNSAVTTPKLASGAVTAAKVKGSSLTGRQIDLATLGTVPSAAFATNASHAGSADSATTAALRHYQVRSAASNGGTYTFAVASHASNSGSQGCTGGTKALGGGVTNVPTDTVITASAPAADGSEWDVTAFNNGTNTALIDVWAICATASP